MNGFFPNGLQAFCSTLVKEIFDLEVLPSEIPVSETRKGHSGDFTVSIFPLAKKTGKSPAETAELLGVRLKAGNPEISHFQVAGGFLNLTMNDSFWKNLLASGIQYSFPQTGETAMVEYSSPNTNKPLHLGHIRNNLLGHSVCELLKANGKKVVKVTLVNDRGVHICKSMLAWKKFGNGETPESSGLKGDKLVGKYYVLFDKALKEALSAIPEQDREKAAPGLPINKEVQQMLVDWEQGNPEIRKLWAMMNGWVYHGFEATYRTLGITFDKVYYESETYLLGKKIVEDGLSRGCFYKEPDQSVWVDLSEYGLEKKVLQRADGTSLYMTQDLGTASLRFDEFKPGTIIYIVGNEQDHHFRVLKATAKKFGAAWADLVFHLSYGMVDLPSGKMKSREGTVVDADDLMEEMKEEAGNLTRELGKTDGLGEEELKNLYKILGLGALKFFMLKVEPKKRMLFNPKESIDFNGHTGPFIQYTYARICSMLRKAGESGTETFARGYPHPLHEKEKEVLKLLWNYPHTLSMAGSGMSPAIMANYAYELAKSFNSFYHDCPVLKAPDNATAGFRLALSKLTGETIKESLRLLGMEVPEKM